MVAQKTKPEGVAEQYKPLRVILELPLAKVEINDLKIVYTRLSDNKVLKKTYPSRHTVQIIHGRLKGDNGAYLLSLMQKVENEDTAERIKQLSKH